MDDCPEFPCGTPSKRISAVEKSIQCPHCTSWIPVPVLEPGYNAICGRCGHKTVLTRSMVQSVQTQILGSPPAPVAPSPIALPPTPPLPPVDPHRFEAPPVAGVPTAPAIQEFDADDLAGSDRHRAVSGESAEYDADDLSASKSDAKVPGLKLPQEMAPPPPVLLPDAMPVTRVMPNTALTPRTQVHVTSVEGTIKYKEKKLAKLAVDLGNLGRTRGYMAAVLFLFAAMLPVSVLMQRAAPNKDAQFQTYFLWDWASPPTAADFSPGTGTPIRVWQADTTHYIYVIGLPLVALLTFLAARFARYRTRGRNYLLLAIVGSAAMFFNPFSHPDVMKSPIGVFDPWLNLPDVLLVPVLGFQLGMMLVLRHFSDAVAVRRMTWAGTAATLGMFVIVALMPIEVAGIWWSTKWDALMDSSMLAGVFVVLLGASVVVLPILQLFNKSPLTHALAVFVVLVLMFLMPFAVFLAYSHAVEPITVYKHFFGIFAPAIMLSIAVAEMMHNGLLMRRVAELLGGRKDAWFSPEFMRMRLQARLESHDIDLAEYKKEIERIKAIEARAAAKSARNSTRLEKPGT